MVVVLLMGGLGNQMFQYAAGRSLALRHGTDLFFDRSFLDRDSKGGWTQRKFELAIFNTSIRWVEANDLLKFQKVINSKPLQFLNKIVKDKFIGNERGFGYNAAFSKFPANTYLNGFWQSEDYFKAIEPAIRKDFTFNDPPINQNAQLASLIMNSNSVSVHIRRSDYINNANALEFHGLCSVEYYQAAIDVIKQNVNDPVFYFFSDDPEWVKANIKVDLPSVYIDHNKGDSSFEDMRLMSLCKHNIIANSSFSWWGAWLNGNTEKIVVAPQYWYNNPRVESSVIVPQQWIKL